MTWLWVKFWVFIVLSIANFGIAIMLKALGDTASAAWSLGIGLACAMVVTSAMRQIDERGAK